jgi:hypothetical protein
MLEFDPDSGYLPPGVHQMGLDVFEQRFGWNVRRRRLCAGLMRALAALARAGCRSVLVDGSFVTSKEEPRDWDAAFDPVGVDASLLDPILLRHDDGRRAMNTKYLGDMFPWGKIASASGAIYLDFFQKDRSGAPKGIVGLTLATIQ